MAELTSVTFTALFKQWRGGDREAGEELFRMIYQDLLRLAQSYLNGDRAGRAIQATTLVHETYLRLFGKDKVDVNCRGHFFVIATRQMRRILIDLSRKKGAAIVTHRLDSLAPEDLATSENTPGVDLIALDKALDVQTDYAKSAYETFMAESQKIAGMYTDLAKQSFKPLEGLVAKFAPVSAQ